MTRAPFDVLFLSAGNSSRSIMAESIINYWGKGRFRGYSAGSLPKDDVDPHVINLLQSLDLPTEGLRAKSWDEFARADAPVMDFVFILFDQEAGEPCPVWPGHPMTGNWTMPDPALTGGSDVEQFRAFRDSLVALENRIKAFAALPLDTLDRISLKRQVDEIGRIPASDRPRQSA
jgi:arsenate reductase